MCRIDLQGFSVVDRHAYAVLERLGLAFLGRRRLLGYGTLAGLVLFLDFGPAGAVPETDPLALLRRVQLTSHAAAALGYGEDLPGIGTYGLACEGADGELLPLQFGGALPSSPAEVPHD